MNLNDWRRRIDEIDKKLVELLNERSRCALRTPPSGVFSNASSTKRGPPSATPCIPLTARRRMGNKTG